MFILEIKSIKFFIFRGFIIDKFRDFKVILMFCTLWLVLEVDVVFFFGYKFVGFEYNVILIFKVFLKL